jgi:hypothetical protein
VHELEEWETRERQKRQRQQQQVEPEQDAVVEKWQLWPKQNVASPASVRVELAGEQDELDEASLVCWPMSLHALEIASLWL